MEKKKYEYITKAFTHEGKRYYVRGKTEREAQKKLREKQRELDTQGDILAPSTTVRRWSAEWMDVYIRSRDITDKSADMYQQKLDNYILPEIGSMKLRDVRDIHLKKLLNNANSSHSTAQKVRLVLQAMFKQARKSRLIPYDPAEDLELPKAPKGKRTSITDWERQNILEVAEYHYAGLYVLTLLYCGLRPGEAAALQWCDIDQKNRQFFIHKAIESGNSSSIKEPKTSAGRRYVPIPLPLWERMEPRIGEPFDYIFKQPRGGKRHTESSLNDYWNNFKRELDIHMGAKVYRNQITAHYWETLHSKEREENWEALVPYSLRHTYGTDLQRAGVPINVAKYLMGHSDIAVTGNIYTDTTPDVIEMAVTKLNDLHRSVS